MSFMYVAIAGVVTAAVGAGVSANAAAKNAAAIADANATAAEREKMLYDDQSKALDGLISKKKEKLYDLGGIFDRFESTGVFGDTNTLENLRTAQEDFSSLAAGDFSGFESQLKKSMSDALITTVGSGSPVGSYAGLAADTQMAYRKDGIQVAENIGEYLSNQANQLLGTEFGIMDQKFQMGYTLERDLVEKMNGYKLGEAQQTGVGQMAMGNAGQQIGASMMTLGMGGASGAFSGIPAAEGINSYNTISQRPTGFQVAQTASNVYGAGVRSSGGSGAGSSAGAVPSIDYPTDMNPVTGYTTNVFDSRSRMYGSPQYQPGSWQRASWGYDSDPGVLPPNGSIPPQSYYSPQYSSSALASYGRAVTAG